MPVYRITDPETGRKIKITGDAPPSEKDIDEIFRSVRVASQPTDDKTIDPETGFPAPTPEQGFPKEDVGAFVEGAALEPRTTRAQIEGGGLGRQLAAKTLDIASTPGRAVAATTAKLTGKDDFQRSMGRTKGEGLVGDIVRSPALPATLAVPGIGQGTGALAKVGQTATMGAIEGGLEGGVRQVEKVAEGQNVRPGEALKEIGTSVALGGLTGGALEGGGQALRKGGEALRGKAVGLAESALKPLKTTVRKGFQPENIFKHGLGGTFEETVEKSAKRLNELDNKVDDIILEAAEANPGATISPQQAIDDFVEKVNAGEFDDFFGDEDQAVAIAEKLRSGFEKKGMLENIPLDQVRRAKQLLGRKSFKKGALQTEEGALKDRVGQEIYRAIKDELEVIAPEIVEPNRAMTEIIPVKKAAEEAIERFGKRNKIMSLSNIATVAGAGGAGAKFTGDPLVSAGLAGGALAAKSFLERGRGAALTDVAGRALQDIPERLPEISGKGARAALRGLSEEQIRNLAKTRK